MEQKVNLSDGKWKLMNELWKKAPCSNGQLVQSLKDETGWNKSTIHIMLSRLEQKGAVRVDKSVSPNLYYPKLEKQQATITETKDFLSKVFGGSIGSMMNCMTGNRQLTRQEIDELYAILKKAEEEAERDD